MVSGKPFDMAIKKDKKRASINLWKRCYMMCPDRAQCIPFDVTFIGKIYQEHICLKFNRACLYLSYTRLCRRSKGLGKKLRKLTKNPITNIVMLTLSTLQGKQVAFKNFLFLVQK